MGKLGNSRFLNMDYYSPRDYKVFDVNMTISPFYDQVEETCKQCIKTLPKLCEKCAKKSPRNNLSYVNYSKSKEPNRLAYKPVTDLPMISDEAIKKAEKFTTPRNDASPIMRKSKAESSLGMRIQEQPKTIDLTQKKAKKKDNSEIYNDDRFYKQSFNLILKQFMTDD